MCTVGQPDTNRQQRCTRRSDDTEAGSRLLRSIRPTRAIEGQRLFGTQELDLQRPKFDLAVRPTLLPDIASHVGMKIAGRSRGQQKAAATWGLLVGGALPPMRP